MREQQGRAGAEGRDNFLAGKESRRRFSLEDLKLTSDLVVMSCGLVRQEQQGELLKAVESLAQKLEVRRVDFPRPHSLSTKSFSFPPSLSSEWRLRRSVTGTD